MKKILLIMLCQLFNSTVNAQTWCPPGAVWNYSLSYFGSFSQPKSGVIQDKYVGDTVINNIVCKHIVGTFKGKMSPASPTVTIPGYRESSSYLNNKVLYVLVSGNTFDTLANFNAAIGDKWLRNRLVGECNGRRAFTVIDTGRVAINNQSLKMIVTTYTSSYVFGTNTFTVNRTDTIIERIMSRQGYMYPMYCEVDNTTDGGIFNGDFLCYEDNFFLLYKRSGIVDCNYTVGLRQLAANGIQTRIYPNPASSAITIASENLVPENMYTVILTNVLGQKVMQTETRNTNGRLQIQVGQVDKGVYYLQLSDKTGLLATDKIIRE